jgi:hypothetical protein
MPLLLPVVAHVEADLQEVAYGLGFHLSGPSQGAALPFLSLSTQTCSSSIKKWQFFGSSSAKSPEMAIFQ